jgi:hypothetical protein
MGHLCSIRNNKGDRARDLWDTDALHHISPYSTVDTTISKAATNAEIGYGSSCPSRKDPQHTGVSSCRPVDVHVDWAGRGYRSSNMSWVDTSRPCQHAVLHHGLLEELPVLRGIVLPGPPKMDLWGLDFAFSLLCRDWSSLRSWELLGRVLANITIMFLRTVGVCDRIQPRRSSL